MDDDTAPRHGETGACTDEEHATASDLVVSNPGLGIRAVRAVHRYRGTKGARRATNVAILLGVLVLLAPQSAPVARLSPGPTPDLTASVAAAQNAATAVNPSFGHGGHFLATTVLANQLTWAGAAWCAVLPGCDESPVEFGNASQVAQPAKEMRTSLDRAAALAATIGGASVAYPTARLDADLGSVGGPSAGLMLTLTFLDARAGGDLTGGRTIAGTGSLDTVGALVPISGVQHKVVGALAAGAVVFFAPTENASDARAAAEGTPLEVVEVGSVGDAVAWLCTHGGDSGVCHSERSK